MIQRFHATDDLADMQSSLMRDGAVIIEKVADSRFVCRCDDRDNILPTIYCSNDLLANIPWVLDKEL